MKKILFLLLFVLQACGNPMGSKEEAKVGDDFRPGVPTPTPTPTTPSDPVTLVGAATGFKITPGLTRATGTTIAASAVVLVNDRRMIGTTISGRFSINKRQVR